jgi:hypothetical protein
MPKSATFLLYSNLVLPRRNGVQSVTLETTNILCYIVQGIYMYFLQIRHGTVCRQIEKTQIKCN